MRADDPGRIPTSPRREPVPWGCIAAVAIIGALVIIGLALEIARA